MQNTMASSRLKTDPATIFDVFVELASPSSSDTCIVWKYPDDYFDEKILKHVVEFAFPCRIAEEAVQLFSFVLTNVEGKYTFGYCRHAPKSNACLCFLSALPWSEFFYKLLNHIASLANNPTVNEVERKDEIELLLVAAYHQELPAPGELFVVDGRERIECIRPNDSKLPKIPDNRHLTEYYNAVDEQNMIAVWASMLCERRIVMVSAKLGRLTSCILAANLLIYPMHWQHIFIPVLPEHLFNYLHAPMPFLIGVPAVNYAKAIKEIDTSDLVLLNVDSREFRSPFADVASLPGEVSSVLKKNLRNSNHLLGDGVARSFLRALVVLIGGYREALQFRPGESILFSPDSFILSRPRHLRHFLTKMLELQIFRQFIEDKLENLNCGFDGCLRDEFEQECSQYSGNEYGKFRHQYNEWFGNMKKEGGAFMKQIKSKVKTKGKEAMRDFRVMLNEFKDESAVSSRSGSTNKLSLISSDKSSALFAEKLTHPNSTGSLNKPVISRPLITLLGESSDYTSNESIDKLSNRSDSSIDRRKTQSSSIKKFTTPPFRHASALSKQRRPFVAPPPRPLSSSTTLLVDVNDYVGGEKNSRRDEKFNNQCVDATGDDVVDAAAAVAAWRRRASSPSAAKQQSLIDELRDIFASPTELLTRLERSTALSSTVAATSRGDVDDLATPSTLEINKVQPPQNVDSLLNERIEVSKADSSSDWSAPTNSNSRNDAIGRNRPMTSEKDGLLIDLNLADKDSSRNANSADFPSLLDSLLIRSPKSDINNHVTEGAEFGPDDDLGTLPASADPGKVGVVKWETFD